MGGGEEKQKKLVQLIPGLWEKNFCRWSPLVCGTLLWWPEQIQAQGSGTF